MITIIIQARMGSTRLPGKVMMDLGGRPALYHAVERSRAVSNADQVIVATTTNAEDDVIEAFCKAEGYPVFRGSSDDVLSRYYLAAKEFGATTVVRITSDCPLIDPSIIEECIEAFQKEECDYISNVVPGVRTFPRGLDVEICSFEALAKAFTEATAKPEREHVTLYIWQNPTIFKLGPIVNATGVYARPQYRLTLDHPEDYELLSKLYTHFYKAGELIDDKEVLAYLDAHPELPAINSFRDAEHVKV